MGKYNFDCSINRRKTYSCRWDVKEGELPLNIADMDFEVLPEIKQAIKDRSELDCYGYIQTPPEYFDAYIHWWKTRHNLELKREWFAFSCSVVGSIDSILKRVAKPSDQVVMFTPIYNVFYHCIKNNGLVLKECEFIYQDNKFDIDWDKFENVIKDEKTKAFIFCNPHNPVGRKFTLEEINKIINLCNKYDVYIISDEIHCDLDFNQDKYVSIFHSELSDYKKIVLLISPTKVFNIAGLQSSAVVVKDPELRELIQNGLHTDDIGEPNYFAVDPVIAAYNHGSEYVTELNTYLYENKRFLTEFLSKFLPNLKLVGGEFTYLMWVDISTYGLKSKEFCEQLRKETGVIFAPGLNYGKDGDNFIRINIATLRKNLEHACNKLLEFLKDK